MSRPRKLLSGIVLLALMAAFGVGVNRYLASRDGSAFVRPKDPTQVHVAPQLSLPGTIFFADGGGLFSLTGTKVTQLQPQGKGWTQPVLLPDGTGLLAVKVTPGYYSDLYELRLTGAVEEQLSHDSGKVTATSLGADDWLSYPAVGPGNTLYFSYDYPKGNVDDPSQCCYQVDLSIWETALGTEIDRSNVQKQDGITQESWANYYTGGDVSPVPLDGGGLLYVDYEFGVRRHRPAQHPHAQRGPGHRGQPDPHGPQTPLQHRGLRRRRPDPAGGRLRPAGAEPRPDRDRDDLHPRRERGAEQH